MGRETFVVVVVCGDLRGHESQPEMEERMVREAGVVVVVIKGGGAMSLENFEGCVPSHPPLYPAARTRF